MTLIGRDGKPLTSIRNMSAHAIKEEFIGDALEYFATDLQRFVAGIQRMAEVHGVTVELETQNLFAEFEALAGRPWSVTVA